VIQRPPAKCKNGGAFSQMASSSFFPFYPSPKSYLDISTHRIWHTTSPLLQWPTTLSKQQAAKSVVWSDDNSWEGRRWQSCPPSSAAAAARSRSSSWVCKERLEYMEEEEDRACFCWLHLHKKVTDSILLLVQTQNIIYVQEINN
jgi:hypothetical protein